MRGLIGVTAVAVALLCAFAAPASAGPFALTGPTTASGPSPFKPGCGGPGEAFDSSVLYKNAEVEPWVAVYPTNTRNVVGFWQQDRWSDGGAHGLLAGVSVDGGQTWSHSAPEFSRCAGGSGIAGGYHRASDPWLSFGPPGRCTRSRSRSTTTRRATRCSPAARSTAGTAGANRPCCGSTTRARSATTSTTRSPSPPTRPTRTTSTPSGTA